MFDVMAADDQSWAANVKIYKICRILVLVVLKTSSSVHVKGNLPCRLQGDNVQYRLMIFANISILRGSMVGEGHS